MFPFDPPTMLAPMEGVTHPELRAILAELGGIGVVSTEFVRIGRGPLSARHLASTVVKAPGTPLSVQVMGNDADKMAEAAAVVARAGADVVDINLGCPAPRVVRKGVGSAMLRDVGLLREVVGQMRSAVPGLLSAKIRAGFDDAANVLAIGRALQDSGIDYLVVHPRRRCDFYEGVADWRIIRALADTLRIPVVGNGDCWYAADALRMMAETGCQAVMIGRPALRNPWIFSQIADLRAGREPRRPTGAELFRWVLSVVERFRTAFPERRDDSVGKVKELFTYLARTVPDQRAFARAVVREPDVPAILARAEATLMPLGPAEIDLGPRGELSLERSGACG
jgi:tRNA-dihydrouridine synthase B